LRKFFASKKTAVLLIVAAMVICTLITPSLAWADDPIEIWGSTTVYPIAENAISLGGWTDMDLQGGGSSYGKSSVSSGACDVGMSSSTVSQTNVDIWTVAADMISFCVEADFYDDLDAADGSADGIVNVTHTKIKELYEQGTNIESYTWGDLIPELTGDVADELVIPLSRIIGSGTRSTFISKIGIVDATEQITQNEVLARWDIDRFAENGDVFDEISSDTGSHPLDGTLTDSHVVGYIGMGFVDEDYVKALYINNVQPDPAFFASYKLSRSLFFATLKRSEDCSPAYDMRAMDFVEYVLSPAGQAAVTNAGFLPVPRSSSPDCWWDIVVDANKRMDVADFSHFAYHWNETGSCGWDRADLNNNGRIDVPDFSKLGSLWNHSWNY
jgi:ABC-type phosphate transport system substrate-binding protein